MSDKGSFLTKPCDDNFCFFIHDFEPNDSLIVRKGRRGRVKGVVYSINSKNMTISYKDANDGVHNVRLNDIIYLGPPERGWLQD